MIISFRDFDRAFELLALPEESPVIVHANLHAFEQVIGGNQAILTALFANYHRILMPAFSMQTLVTPREGPEHNAINYNDPLKVSHSPEFFDPELPVSEELGEFAEFFRQNKETERSRHPVLSFSGRNLPTTLAQQTLNDPFAPIKYLENKKTWVLLVGANQTQNISLHIAAQRAGRPQLIRWALTPTGIKQFENFPTCQAGFEHIRPHLNVIAKRERIGEDYLIAYPLDKMLKITQNHLQENPLSMLCDQANCLSCHEVRHHVSHHHPKYESD